MKIQNGELARDFTISDIYGKTIKLSDFKGTKTILSFYRNVNCPFCNMRAHELNMMSKRLKELNVNLIWVFESSSETLRKSTFHQGISPIPLIGDPSHKIFDLYKVETSNIKMLSTYIKPNIFKTMNEAKKLELPTEKDKDASISLIPADFLINKYLFIENAHYGKHLNDHIPIIDIKEFAGY